METIKAYLKFNILYRIKRLKERLTMKIVWCMPKTLVRWCVYRVLAKATTGKYGKNIVSQVTCFNALDIWEEK